jgi:peptidyl-prolyl cis-trans isomerase A (cyclophilin A)
MSRRRRASARCLIALALVLAAGTWGCDGRTAWREEPLPDYGPVEPPAPLPADAPRIRIATELGDVVVALYADRAPVSTANFLEYVDTGFYDGTLFHRVTRAPMIVVQGGGFGSGMTDRPTRGPIANEATNGLSNVRGTVAMARTNAVDSATSQFYVNVVDNTMLDHRDPGNYGYAVFGFVVEGMAVIDRISMAPTEGEAPVDEIAMLTVRRDR